jgi:hypothetical protein
MGILKDIPIALQPPDVIAAPKGRQHRPELLRDAATAIALGHDLWQPRAVYDWFDVDKVEGQDVHLSGPQGDNGNRRSAVLSLGPKADLLAPARRVLISVLTIGPALESRVQALQAERETLIAYLLDSAGVVALGEVGEAIRCLAEETAAELGWGVGPALSPGSLVGWPIQGQRPLCGLLPLDQIGVQLNDYCVLEPHKSTSVLIGLGPDYESGHVGSVCTFCALKDTCWRRKEALP